MGETLTTEEALVELRKMFPTGYIEIAYGEDRNGVRYVGFEGCSKERWTPKRHGDTLEEVMAKVREWKASQQ